MEEEHRQPLTRMTTAEENRYFDVNAPPSSLDKHVEKARDFIEFHASSTRRVVLVTSGGTTVPLENQTVRFIDNFSAGTRGATSAEYLLDAGYAVIFLHRQYSLLPFSRHYSHSTNCFLDFMDFAVSNGTSSSQSSDEENAGRIVVRDEYQSQMRGVLQRYKNAQSAGLLMLLPFVTINEYLWNLREIARLMKPLGSGALFYLAAAVSDFFVPADKMVEHKIQSGADFHKADAVDRPAAAHVEGQSLIIDLDPVPKFLKRVVDAWAPNAMIVSFKLETDPGILSEKARHALKKYAHHLVIGNLLTTRKWEVVFVSNVTYKGGRGQVHEQWIRVPRAKRQSSVSGIEELIGKAQNAVDGVGSGNGEYAEPAVEIESLIIPEVSRLHAEFMSKRG